MKNLIVGCGLLLALFMGVSGCTNSDKPEVKKPSGGSHDHDHDHDHGDHDHEHEMGPKGGHVVKFDGNKGFASWDHKDNEDKVLVYLLSDDRKSLQGRKVDRVYFVQTAGDQRQEYNLTAIANDENGDNTFELVDKALIAAVKMGTELIVETPDGQLRVEIEPHIH